MSLLAHPPRPGSLSLQRFGASRWMRTAHAGELVFPHLERSAGVVSTMATTCRTMRSAGSSSCPESRTFSRLTARVPPRPWIRRPRSSAPTRSPYREKLFEKRGRHEEVHARLQRTSAPTAPSSTMPVAEALVSHVQERHQAARLQNASHHLLPHWPAVQVVAAGVVAAGVQHHHRCRVRPRLQRGQHGVEVGCRGGPRRSRGRCSTSKPALRRTARGGSPSSDR